MDSTATVTVLFCDVVGSTERLVRIGDVAGDALRRDLFGRLRRAVVANGGIEVKNLGDGLMVVFPKSTIGALVCARDMHLEAAAVDPVDPVRLRIGISAGEVAVEDDDWFGIPVVQAARLCSAAAADQTLATALVRTLVGTRAADHDIRGIGELDLKGLADPVATVEIGWKVDDVGPVDAPEAPASATPLPTTSPEPAPAGSPSNTRANSRAPRRALLATTAVVIVAVLGFGAFNLFGSDDGSDARTDDAAMSDAITEPVGYEPEFRSVECGPATAAAVPSAECGELVVPESRDDPDGSKIAVPVTKVDALRDTGAAPVILADVNEPVARTSLTQVADVYSLGLRGFGTSVEPDLTCDELARAWDDTLDLRADDDVAIDAHVEAARACAQRLRDDGVHLEGYNMAEAADDIRDLALAAELGQVTVSAGGFTTPAAVGFARANPGLTNALMLTNPVRPGSSPLEDPAGWLAYALDELIAMCDEDAACAAEHPDLAERYRTRFDELAKNPVLVSTESLVGTGPHDVLLDGRRWAAALESVLYESGRLGLVPEAIGNASDELIAATGIDEDVKSYAGPASNAGALLSFMCSYDAGPNRTAEISANATPEFAGANEASFSEMCEAWDVPSVFDLLSQPFLGSVPTLLAQGGLSLGGPADWAGSMADQLDAATVVQFPTMSNDLAFAPPPCLRKLRNEFAVDPSADLDVESCEASSPQIDFGDGS